MDQPGLVPATALPHDQQASGTWAGLKAANPHVNATEGASILRSPLVFNMCPCTRALARQTNHLALQVQVGLLGQQVSPETPHICKFDEK